MEYINKLLNKQDYKLNNISENFEMIIYSSLAFFIPFFLGHPQWFVGIIVNMSLVLCALNLRTWKILPVIILPSIAVLSRGIIFGTFTPFLLYMIPLIWVGNFLLVIIIKQLVIKNKINQFLSLIIGAISKSSLLFISAFFFVSLEVLPFIFLSSMGIIQFYTAFSGGLIALGIQKIKKNK